MNKKSKNPFVVLSAILLMVPASTVVKAQPQETTPPDPVKTTAVSVRPVGEFRMVPVRVHLLRDSEPRAAITTLTEADIARIFKKVNGIWHTAGVHLWVESIVAEKPASAAGFEHVTSMPIPSLLALRPAASKQEGMFHIYYIGSMDPNGIFMQTDALFVKESAVLRPVEGGIDEPLPRVSAHELGHGMGLPHRQDTFNLMASGTTGTGLNEAEIATVRKTIERFAWVLTPEAFMKQADDLQKAGHKADAKSRYIAIGEIPGESKIKKAAQKKSSKR